MLSLTDKQFIHPEYPDIAAPCVIFAAWLSSKEVGGHNATYNSSKQIPGL